VKKVDFETSETEMDGENYLLQHVHDEKNHMLSELSKAWAVQHNTKGTAF